MMQHHDAVQPLLQPHSAAIKRVHVLCRSPGRHWIHQQSCEALASTYKQAFQKLTNMLTNMLTAPLLREHRHLNPHDLLQRLVQPALEMVLAAIRQGESFLQTCRPSLAQLAKSNSVQHHASSSASPPIPYPRGASSAASSNREVTSLSSEHTISSDESWLYRALLKGNAIDAMDIHLHDFLMAFSAVVAAIEDLYAQYMHQRRMTLQHSADQPLSSDLFWKEQNKPHVLLVSGQHLNLVKHNDETVLYSQLEHAMNPRGSPNDVQQQNTTITTAADIDLAAFVKEKMRCAKQAFQESIDLSFFDINELEVINIIVDSFPISVHKVMWLGREFALKLYKKAMEEAFLQEAKIHVRLHHPNVVHAVALFKGEKGYGILVELMDENLKNFLKRHPFRLTLQEKVCTMLQIAKGMAHVHGRGLIHRDLKPTNVLVRSSTDTQAFGMQQLEVKIADFGESNSKSPDSSSFTTKRLGTTVYRAPEVLNRNIESTSFTLTYKRSADVYSFAMTCFELLVEEEPFDGSERREALWERVINGERPNIESISDTSCPPYLKHCLKIWWAEDPKTRHSFTHICCILRHLYACLASRQRDTETLEQFPFLAWPFWRWKKAQDIVQERFNQFEISRENDDWKHKGYVCESTRVNEIPYEMHVMHWAIKKAADAQSEEATEATNNSADAQSEEATEATNNSQSDRVQTQPYRSNIHNHSPINQQSTSHTNNSQTRSPENLSSNTQVSATALPANSNRSPPGKSFGEKLKEFCCFSAHITPTNHEAFHDDVSRRNR